MHTFFHGWRRKAGLVLLMMALMCAADWTQSHLGGSLTYLTRTKRIVAMHGSVTLVVMDRGDQIKSWIKSGMSAQKADAPVPAESRWSQKWQRTFAGVDLGSDVYGNANQELDRATWYRVPYWSVVLFLTLLSAWLILWRPRKSASGPN